MISQLELIKTLEKNPKGFKVYFLETGKVNNDGYIFIDKIDDVSIYADGERKYTNTNINISIYSNSNKSLQEVTSYAKKLFRGSVIYGKEEGLYKAVLMTSVKVKEWQ